jgi:hypothetical protein
MDINVKDFQRSMAKCAGEGKTIGRWSEYPRSPALPKDCSRLFETSVSFRGAVNKKIAPAYLPRRSFVSAILARSFASVAAWLHAFALVAKSQR